MLDQTFLEQFAPLASGPGGVQKLREMVLQLAVRGKLVPQRREDADGLLGILRAHYYESNNGTYPIAEPLFETPPNWKWTTLRGVGSIVGGGTPKTNEPSNYAVNDVAWLTPADLYGFKGKYVSEGKRFLSEKGLSESSAQLMPTGTVLFSSRAPIGYSAIAARPLATNQGFKSCVPFVGEMSEFILVYMRASIQEIERRASGTTFKEVSGKVVGAIPIPVPPLGEQRRIVAKVDELMALCDELEAQQEREIELKHATAISLLHHLVEVDEGKVAQQLWRELTADFQELFDDFDTISTLRGHLLQLAMQGKLVSQVTTDEPVANYLHRIGATSRKGKSNKPVAKDVVFSIPDNWEWVSFGDFANEIATGPFGTMIHKGDYVRGGTPLVNPSHMIDDKIFEDEFVSLPNELVEQLHSYRLKTGDIVFARRGEVGRLALVSERENGWLCGTGSFRARFDDDVYRPYLVKFFHTEFARKFLRGASVGATMVNLNQKILGSLPVPVPPLAEQKRIVLKVDELMALCDQLEKEVREDQRLRAELMASLVQKFVDTDHDTGSQTVVAIGSGGLKEANASFAGTNEQVVPELKSLSASVATLEPPTVVDHKPAEVDTKFKEAVLVGAVVRAFFETKNGGEPLGNFRLQKAVYFARRHNGEHALDRDYSKQAAGPYNPSMKYSGGIAIAKSKGWIREARGRFGFGHIPMRDSSDLDEWIGKYSYQECAHWVVQEFRFSKNDEWELLATVDYTIESLTSHDIEPDARKILQFISSDREWQPKIEKLGLNEAKIQSAMDRVSQLFDGANG